MFVGVDIGGTTASIALVDENGIIDKVILSVRDYSEAEGFVSAACGAIETMLSRQPKGTEVVGIGVGAPCANSSTGEIEAATNMPWPSPIPLKRLFEDISGYPTVISNDANAAAAGEMLYGNARGMSNFIVLTLGTGVGSGVVCDGHLLIGCRGFAGELGHVTVDAASDRVCGCGRHGCLENYCSASGLVETARRLIECGDFPTSDLINKNFTAKDVYEAAVAGDAAACEAMKETGRWLGYACAQFAAFTDPEAIIFFGGVAQAGSLLLEPVKEAFEASALHLYRNRVKFLTTGLPGPDAALLGAAALVRF